MNRFEKWSVWLSAAATALSGLGLLYTKYFVESADRWAVIHHPLEPFFLKAHILVSPLLLFALGLIARRHVWQHYRAGNGPGRKSGLITVGVTAPLVITGYLIQVITHVGWLRAMALAHIVFGLLFAVGLALHQVFVHRRVRAAADGTDAISPRRPRPQASRHPAVAAGD